MTTCSDGYPDLVADNLKRTLLDTIGRDLLEQIVGRYLTALDSAITVYEANGDYTTGLRPHGWCRVMDELSMPDLTEVDAAVAVETGRWTCRASCRRPALAAMSSGEPIEVTCRGGVDILAVPIFAAGVVVGAISCGRSAPPLNEMNLSSLAKNLGTTTDRLEARAAAVKQGPGEPAELNGAAVENLARMIGELFVARRALRDREQVFETSIGALAHELRGPISVIVAGTSLLQMKAKTQQREDAVVDRMQRSANTMRRVVDDALDLTRSRHAGGVHLDLAPCDIAALCVDLIDERGLIDPRHTIRFEHSGDATVRCDAGRVRRVIENLLSNAIRHGDGPIVDVAVLGADDHVRLRVHNGGDPIPADRLASIFEPFDQGNAEATGRASQGIGLGLYIAREIIRSHGGTIEVESSEGVGTTLSVVLPRAAAASAGH